MNGGPGIVLRPAVPADAAAFGAADRSLFGPQAWSVRTFQEEISGPNRTYLVADAGGRLAGYAGIWFDGVDATLMTIGVLKPWQGRGIGGLLLETLTRTAGELGAARLLLEVAVDNAGALALYERAGFQVLGRRRGYYQPGGTDAWTMAKDLAGAAN